MTRKKWKRKAKHWKLAYNRLYQAHLDLQSSCGTNDQALHNQLDKNAETMAQQQAIIEKLEYDLAYPPRKGTVEDFNNHTDRLTNIQLRAKIADLEKMTADRSAKIIELEAQIRRQEVLDVAYADGNLEVCKRDREMQQRTIRELQAKWRDSNEAVAQLKKEVNNLEIDLGGCLRESPEDPWPFMDAEDTKVYVGKMDGTITFDPDQPGS